MTITQRFRVTFWNLEWCNIFDSISRHPSLSSIQASGLAIFCAGIWMQVELHQYLELNNEYSNIAPYILVGTGAFILLVSTLACCCTVKGHPTLLYMVNTYLRVCVCEIEISWKGNQCQHMCEPLQRDCWLLWVYLCKNYNFVFLSLISTDSTEDFWDLFWWLSSVLRYQCTPTRIV